MNKILVTGGSGLLGNELIHQLLQQGNNVRAIINKSPISIQHPNLEIISCDLLDVITLEDAMQNIKEYAGINSLDTILFITTIITT